MTKFFRSVDLLEPVHHFIEKAKATLKDKVQNYFEESLEEFSFEEDGKALAGYEIWIQWCIGQLSDALYRFVEKSKGERRWIYSRKKIIARKGFTGTTKIAA